MLIHASCVSFHEQGILILGPSGAGKSDLALRLIHAGASLVGDDQIILTQQNDNLWASAPTTLAGLIEIRYQGIFCLPYRLSAKLALTIQLIDEAPPRERLAESTPWEIMGIRIRQLYLTKTDRAALEIITTYLSYPSINL
ncbi:MAG: HPr kinase/phosphorylase [Alphaproteobacteria bacterium]